MTEDDVLYCDGVVCLGNAKNKYLTMTLAERALAEGIPGDFAECGVLSGGHPAIMARVLKTRNIRDRRVHLYDSFEGVPQPGPDDEEDYRKTYGVNPDRTRGIALGRCVGTVEQVRANMRTWNVPESSLVYHIGWLQEMLPRQEIPKLALLRVDVDLYDSTTPIFKYLYPAMPSGAFVISDDWGEGPNAPCRLATIRALGGWVPDVTPVEGQPTTVWWRKP